MTRALRCAAVALLPFSIASAAFAAPSKFFDLMWVHQVGQGPCQIVLDGSKSATTGHTTIVENAGFFGDLGPVVFGADPRNVKDDLTLSTESLPEGVSLTLDSAKVSWNTEAGYHLKLVLKAEVKGFLLPSEHTTDLFLTNKRDGWITRLHLRLLPR